MITKNLLFFLKTYIVYWLFVIITFPFLFTFGGANWFKEIIHLFVSFPIPYNHNLAKLFPMSDTFFNGFFWTFIVTFIYHFFKFIKKKWWHSKKLF